MVQEVAPPHRARSLSLSPSLSLYRNSCGTYVSLRAQRFIFAAEDKVLELFSHPGHISTDIMTSHHIIWRPPSTRYLAYPLRCCSDSGLEFVEKAAPPHDLEVHEWL